MHAAFVTCTSAKATLIQNDIYRFWIKIYCHPDNMVFREDVAYFRQTVPDYILHVFQQHNSAIKEFGLQTLLSQTFTH